MAWVQDHPGGVYKDHAISDDVRMEATADAIFMQWVSPERGFGKRKGQSITTTRFHSLPQGTRVLDTETLPIVRPQITTVINAVSEWGAKVELTEFEQNLAHFVLEPKVKAALRDQMSRTMDTMVAVAMKSTIIRAVLDNTSGGVPTITNNGVFGGTADDTMTLETITTLKDYFRQTHKAPPFRNGKYVFVVSTKAARNLLEDPAVRAWLQPNTAQPLRTGSVDGVQGVSSVDANFLGSIENVDIWVTNHDDSLADGIGSSAQTGEGLFFARDPAVLAQVQTPEIRMEPAFDLGRFLHVGWVGELDAGLIWNDTTQARCIYVGSL